MNKGGSQKPTKAVKQKCKNKKSNKHRILSLEKSEFFTPDVALQAREVREHKQTGGGWKRRMHKIKTGAKQPPKHSDAGKRGKKSEKK